MPKTRVLELHPEHPQRRRLRQLVEALGEGAVFAYPTDSCFALGCVLTSKDAQERVRAIRELDARHNLTLVCRDLSELGQYAKVEWRWPNQPHWTHIAPVTLLPDAAME